MTDKLVINNLSAECRLGVFEWERAKPQTVSIDVELTIDAARVAAEDDVRHAVDYAKLIACVKQLAEQRPYRLMETLAETLAEGILRACETPQVKVAIKKRALPGIGYAAVEVERIAARRPATRCVSRRRRMARVPR